MKTALNKYPSWIERALQGITYWIGHRRCFYRSYPLSEGALVAEVCNLIHANLPDALSLMCEVQYSKILRVQKMPEKLPKKPERIWSFLKKKLVRTMSQHRNLLLKSNARQLPRNRLTPTSSDFPKLVRF